jgi:toxin ParE1/3/4
MAIEIIIRATARLDTVELAKYLLQQSAVAADRFLDACELTFSQLAAEPGIGSLYQTGAERFAGLRVFPVRGFPNHLAFYLTKESHLEIVRVLHGSRDLDAALQQD